MSEHVSREEFAERLAGHLRRKAELESPRAEEVAAEIALAFYANGFTMLHTSVVL